MEFDRENPEKVNSGFSKWIGQTMEKAGRRGIQFTVLVSFTVVSVFIMVLLWCCSDFPCTSGSRCAPGQ